MVIYRESGYDELDRYRNLLADFCNETNADFNALDLILEKIENGRTNILIAEDGEDIIGIVGFLFAGTAAIADFFYVIPERRASTIGGNLYQRASKYAKEFGANKIVAIVSEDKESLYTKIGFSRKFILLEKEI